MMGKLGMLFSDSIVCVYLPEDTSDFIRAYNSPIPSRKVHYPTTLTVLTYPTVPTLGTKRHTQDSMGLDNIHTEVVGWQELCL